MIQRDAETRLVRDFNKTVDNGDASAFNDFIRYGLPG